LKIVALMEDNLCGENLCAEHGFSIYIETNRHKLLVDTGQSPITWKNAKVRGVDLEAVDTIVLSHGHYDHSGGLMALVGQNTKAKIYLRDNAGGDYYSYKENAEKYIGIDKNILTLANAIPVSEDMVIDEELSIYTKVTGRRLWPKGNLRLHERIYDKYVQDEFSHEQYLVIRYESDKYALISGCAHNGILNILDRFREIYHTEPSIVISGFHMILTEYTDADLEAIKATAKELAKMNTIFYTGHCTGQVAFDLMKEILGDQLQAIKEL